MFHFTDIEVAPWTVIKSNDKNGGRINALRHVLTTLGYTGRDLEWIGQPDPLLVVYAAAVI